MIFVVFFNVKQIEDLNQELTSMSDAKNNL